MAAAGWAQECLVPGQWVPGAWPVLTPTDGAPRLALTRRCGPLGGARGTGGLLCGVTSPHDSTSEGAKPSVLGQDQKSTEGAGAGLRSQTRETQAERTGLVCWGGAAWFWPQHFCGCFKPVPPWGSLTLADKRAAELHAGC